MSSQGRGLDPPLAGGVKPPASPLRQDLRDMADIRYALRYAGAGLRVHPLYEVDPSTQTCACPKGAQCGEKQRGKHPRLGAWQDKASTDEALVREWWVRWPRAGIGIATGSASRTWVLDVDGPDAMAWYDAQVIRHGLTPTLGVRTSRGAHLYWRWPDDAVVRNAQGLREAGAPGVDVRGEGGYVCAPPTVHRSGHVYAWVHAEEGFAREMAPAPSWLLDLVKERPKPPPPVMTTPRGSLSPRQVAAMFRVASDRDPVIRERVGQLAGGRLHASAARPYMDGIRCPKCGRPEVWFYLDEGPAVCHHRNSCQWAGPITTLATGSP